MAGTAAPDTFAAAIAVRRAGVLLARVACPPLGAHARTGHALPMTRKCVAPQGAARRLVAEARVDNAVGRLPADVAAADTVRTARMAGAEHVFARTHAAVLRCPAKITIARSARSPKLPVSGACRRFYDRSRHNGRVYDRLWLYDRTARMRLHCRPIHWTTVREQAEGGED